MVTGAQPPTPDPRPPSEFHELLAEYLERVEREGTAALEQFRRDHPGFTARLDKRLAWLGEHLARRATELPERVGPFRVLQCLGSGGMGQVYLAEQSAPFRRLVAVKVIRADRAIEARVARFATEIQALASLNHDGIARLFEAGDADGQPYFAMEYVPGVPITDYCAEERLPLAERLRLFVRVCRAVEHAHRRGILHRDLKPTNVLVHGPPADPAVKVIDFGLAKMVAPDGERSAASIAGQVLGTPEYMSPEQADESGQHPVDTRSDVYSLGAMLYELLTGFVPLGLDRAGDHGLAAVLRDIRERQPSSPSVRVEEGRSDTTSPTAAGVGVTPHRLSRMLAGDLDAIVMKALAKDAEQRYGGPAELADDLERHLRNEPVLACARTRRYVLAKFVRRHRIGVAFAATVLVVSFGSLVAMNVLAQRNIRDLERAELFALARYVQDLHRTDALPPPARREHVPAMTALLREYERLLGERPRLATFLAREVPAADSRGGWGGELAGRALADTVRELDGLLAGIAAPGAEIDKLRQRIEWATIVEQRTIGEHGERWRRVCAELRSDERFAHLDLQPQRGLVPLWRNAQGLQEFALLLPGTELPGPVPAARDAPVFVLVPGGRVVLGSQSEAADAPNHDPMRFPNEDDVRELLLPPLFVCKFELTCSQWALLDPGARLREPSPRFDGPLQPIVAIDAHAMQHVLLAWGMRLPTSAEWEHLARGGAPTPWHTGATAATLMAHANVHDAAVARSGVVSAEGQAADWDDGYEVSAPVGSFRPNAFGLHDVHGNAAEIAVREVADGAAALELRGGSWHQAPIAARVTATAWWPGEALDSIGVRPVIAVQR